MLSNADTLMARTKELAKKKKRIECMEEAAVASGNPLSVLSVMEKAEAFNEEMFFHFIDLEAYRDEMLSKAKQSRRS